jgi:hypothetical protein
MENLDRDINRLYTVKQRSSAVLALLKQSFKIRELNKTDVDKYSVDGRERSLEDVVKSLEKTTEHIQIGIFSMA